MHDDHHVVGAAKPHEVVAILGQWTTYAEGLRQQKEQHEQHIGYQPGDAGGQRPQDRTGGPLPRRISLGQHAARLGGEVSRCHGTMSRFDRDSSESPVPGSPAGTPHLADPENWVVSASAEVKAAQPRAWRSSLARRAPAIVAVVLVLLGVIAVAVRLDAPSDGTVVSFYRVDGVVVDVPHPIDGPGLQTGDVVTEIAGHRLADGLGGLARPQLGDELAYDVTRDGTARVTVRVNRTDPYPLLVAGWGNLVFVFALAGLATALFLRRPEEPSTTPMLIAGAGLLGSTLAFTAGIPALTLATGGPALWLYNLSVVGVYSLAWGPVLAFGLQLFRLGRGRGPGRAVLAAAYTAPLG